MTDLPCGFLLVDDSRNIVEANDEAMRLLRRPRDALLGENLSRLLAPGSRMFFQTHVFPSLALTGRVDELYVSLLIDGGEHPFLLSAKRQPLVDGSGFGLVFLPIHRRALFERELVRAQETADEATRSERALRAEMQSIKERLSFTDRLSALGTLAAGTAHEINNPLTYVTANLEYLLDALGGDAGEFDRSGAREIVAEALEGTTRIRKIVDDLRVLSRQETPPRHPVRLEEVIASSLRLTTPIVKGSARVETVVRAEGLVVSGDEGRLVQVLVNLIVNAAQALTPNAHGEPRILISLDLDPGGWALLAVSDNGGGIPEAIRERIFEPFYTTKPPGMGTGLGLSVCRGIVEDLGGAIELRSDATKGTTFELRLPTHAESGSWPVRSVVGALG